tara:strand:+ start:290 stop:487 length:198 start_codon:yes stop_codon:yes gene_type:complete
MTTTTLNKLKQSGEYYFKRTADAKAVYEISHYNHSDKTYCCIDAEDMNRCIFIKATKSVFIGFEY